MMTPMGWRTNSCREKSDRGGKVRRNLPSLPGEDQIIGGQLAGRVLEAAVDGVGIGIEQIERSDILWAVIEQFIDALLELIADEQGIAHSLDIGELLAERSSEFPQLADVLQKERAFFGQTHTAGSPHQKLAVQLLFQLTQHLADVLAGHMQLFTGCGDIADVGNGVKNLQLGKIHGDSSLDKLLLL